MSKLLLLDRDGVICEDLPEGVTRIGEFRFLPGVREAIARFTAQGWRVAVITNQSGVAKGLMTLKTLAEIHRYMREEIEKAGGRIDAVYCCTDHPERPGLRRKPAPGMLLEALADFGAIPEATPMIGDALRDMEAAAAAGCRRVLVRTGKGEATLKQGFSPAVEPVLICADLAAAAVLLAAE